MEAKKEQKLGFLPTIKPPRIEDAGLEDCALPPHYIHLAFLKAASAVVSRAADALTGEKTEGCVSDPWIGKRDWEVKNDDDDDEDKDEKRPILVEGYLSNP